MTATLERSAQDSITAAVAEIAESRAIIEQAKGMIILVYGLDDACAFDLLRRVSQSKNIKLRAVAAQLVADFRAIGNGKALPPRSTYDKALATIHERITSPHLT